MIQCGGILRDDLDINSVGFGEHANGLSVTSNADGIDDNDWQTDLVAGSNQSVFIPAGCFNNDALDLVVFEDLDEATNVRFGIWNGIELTGGVKGDVQIGFTDIDTDIDWGLDFRVFHNMLTLPCYTGSRPR